MSEFRGYQPNSSETPSNQSDQGDFFGEQNSKGQEGLNNQEGANNSEGAGNSESKSAVPKEVQAVRFGEQLEIAHQQITHYKDRVKAGDSSITSEIEALDPELSQMLAKSQGEREELHLSPEDMSVVTQNWERIEKMREDKDFDEIMRRLQDGSAGSRPDIQPEKQKFHRPKGILVFENLEQLQDAGIARELAKFRGTLYFSGVTELSDEVLQELCRHEGPLFLPKLKNVSERGEAMIIERGLRTPVSFFLTGRLETYRQRMLESRAGSLKNIDQKKIA